MSLTPVDLVAAHPWQRVAFTTYALSLSFFEAVILDALVRAKSQAQALILADVRGARASISEQGAQRVGKEYEVEPVLVTNGFFHPKIAVFSSPGECHLLVGSGNLSFGGWGGNCEILEHVHSGFAADALADAADFFELLGKSQRVRHGATQHCAAIADEVRRSIRDSARNGNIRLFHSLAESITDQVARTVADLGGPLKLVCAAPYWDSGAAIDDLCRTIGLDEVFVHSHAGGCVEGTAGDNWPRGSRTRIRPVRIDVMDTPDEVTRRLHAKAFEVLCKRGRVVVSGSANGTTAAWGTGRNVEACLIRLQRERSVGWSYVNGQVPDPPMEIEDESDTDSLRSGVLRAVLEADEMKGLVLTPRMSSPVLVYHLATSGLELLAETAITADGVFSLTTPGLETWSWRGGRLVIRVQDREGRQAEGFVSIASFADIARRVGIVGRHLFALIAGSETPADIAAIMSWFSEDPQRLVSADPNESGGSGSDADNDDFDRLIPVAALGVRCAEAGVATRPLGGRASRGSWSRFVDQILWALREPRGPLGNTGRGRVGDDEDDEDGALDGRAETREEDPAVARGLSAFTRVFDFLTKDGSPARNALLAFDLTQYVCERLQPDEEQAKRWLERLIKALLGSDVPPERRDHVAAAVLTVLGVSAESPAYRWARACLVRLEVDFSGEAPPVEPVRGYQGLLLQQIPFNALWARLRVVRTHQEQVRSYKKALEGGKPSDEYPDLLSLEEWPLFLAALSSPQARERLLFVKGSPEACPRCHIKLPTAEINKLRSTGIATAKNCCARVVIWESD